jgi:hypothetical protein
MARKGQRIGGKASRVKGTTAMASTSAVLTDAVNTLTAAIHELDHLIEAASDRQTRVRLVSLQGRLRREIARLEAATARLR